MARQDDGFDVLTFYIYVMALLTAIVGGFALWNRKKVEDESKKIKYEIGKLDQMKQLASDADLRAWIARERGAQETGVGAADDFQAKCRQLASQNSITIISQQAQGARELPDGRELTFRLTIEQCRVENLVKFLVLVEEQWPGARVKAIVKLDWNERRESWDAVVELSIFKATAA